jgi:Ca2+-binding RTX toxin-like protein
MSRINGVLRCLGAVVISTGGAATAVIAAPTPAGATSVGGHVCTVVGTSGNDVLYGTAGRDVICGLGGNDKLVGRGGNDLLYGGRGNDTIVGGPGNDVEDGGAGRDTITGGTGTDTENGDTGNDHLSGDAGPDHLNGGPGNDVLSGDDGNDSLNGGSGDDVDLGGQGDDNINEHDGTVDGGPGSDDVECGSGTGTVFVASDGEDNESESCRQDGQELQKYEGTVTAVDTTNNTITVQYSDVNDSAQTWLDANGDPNPVTIALTPATHVEDGPAQTGDQVEVDAQPAADPTSLEAVVVSVDD